jgi:hypothetical protein
MNKTEARLANNPKQWVRFGLVVLPIVLLLTVGSAVAMHLADDQFINSAELKQNLKELESYAAEAKLISDYSHKQALRTYTEAYSNALQEAVQSINEKLSEHPHAGYLNDKVNQTIELSDDLSGQLQTLATIPPDQWPSDFSQSLNGLTNRFQVIEVGL